MSKMEYRGYCASIKYDEADNIFVGEVLEIADSLIFHGSSVEELQTMFSQCIDNYLEICQRIGEAGMELLGCEQETIVNYNAEEQIATLYTRDKDVMRKLDLFVLDFPHKYKLMNQDEVSKTYVFPKSCINYCIPSGGF